MRWITGIVMSLSLIMFGSYALSFTHLGTEKQMSTTKADEKNAEHVLNIDRIPSMGVSDESAAVNEKDNTILDADQGKAIAASHLILGFVTEKGAAAAEDVVYRDEYAGSYIRGEKLVILLTTSEENVISQYKDFFSYDPELIIFEKAEHSYNELLLCWKQVSVVLGEKPDLWYYASIDIAQNCIRIGIAEAFVPELRQLIQDHNWSELVQLELGGPIILE